MKGTYILVVFIKKNIKLIIGALGKTIFSKGYYFYIGSAMGSSGAPTLINRVKRHISSPNKKKVHWHIDYLLYNKNVVINYLYIIPSLQKLECLIANELLNISDGYIKKFGSSDCLCNSHLLYFKDFKSLRNIFQ
ncbi:MAG: GIY-YIG nuclease family protein [Promethearchaeota archaeon]|nr:MAG: GIY-YIG nuclease family protein [Candidatus Lokiarchaeota archaeon]